jgi:hypothetical protein
MLALVRMFGLTFMLGKFMEMFDKMAYPSLAFEYILWCSNYCYKKYNNFSGICHRPATFHYCLKCLQRISVRLKFLPNGLGSIECLVNRFVTIHFLPFLKFICFSGIAGSLVHAFFLHLP